MRIISMRVAPVARVLAIAYAVFGFIAFIIFALSRADNLTLPVGIVAPFLALTVNFKFGRSTDLVYDAMVGLGAVLLYAATGWITGTVAALCFNFVAKKTGGIDVQSVLTVKEGDVVK